jgi:hypothetical protein
MLSPRYSARKLVTCPPNVSGLYPLCIGSG